MMTLTLYCGLAFASLGAAVLIYPVSRYYVVGWLTLMRRIHPWIVQCACLILLIGALFFERYVWAIVLEVLLLIGMIVSDRSATRRLERQRKTTLTVLSQLLTYLRSGFDLMSAVSRLENAKHADVAQLGKLLSGLMRVGVNDPTLLRTHRKWRDNVSLMRFIDFLFSFTRTGSNPIPWLERSRAYIQKKVQFRKTLSVKTTQIKMQMYVLTVFSWMLFGVTLILFPEILPRLMQRTHSLIMIVVGLGFQISGIFFMIRSLATVITEES